MARSIQILSLSALVAASLLAMPAPSHAADPTTADCLGANESAISLRNEHKLRAARAQLLVCAAANCPTDIRSECVRRVAEVNQAIPTIVFEVKDAAGRDLSAVKVTIDGQPLAERLEGMALSIDPGEHTFTFTTAGQATVEKQFVIRENEKGRRERITFGEAATPAPITAVPTPAPAPTSAPPPPAAPPVREAPSRPGDTQRVAAYVVGGVGVVGLVVGTVFGLQAKSKQSDSEAYCGPADLTICSQQGADLIDQGKRAATLSNVAFVVGGLGLAGGVVLYLTAPASSTRSGSLRIAPAVGTDSVGALLQGAF